MASVNIKPEELKKLAKQLNESADKINNGVYKKLESANESLAPAWAGDSGDTFIKFMKEFDANLAKNIKNTREIANVINQTATSMQQADSKVKSMIR